MTGTPRPTNPLVEGAEVRERTDLEGGVLVGGVGEQRQVVGLLSWVASEEGAGAEDGRVGRAAADYLKAKHVVIERGEGGRVAGAEADVVDADHLRHFLLAHGLFLSLG